MWKDIEGYEGLYQVSDEGQIRRLLLNGKTNVLKNRDGIYYTVCLSDKCRKKTVSVHRVVADAFLEKPFGATEVNHKDGNKHNNHVDNLEWVSQRDNFLHAVEQIGKNPYGKAPRKVKCLNKDTGEVVLEFHSLSEAARAIGKVGARSSITNVCQGYQATAYGYKWEYAD